MGTEAGRLRTPTRCTLSLDLTGAEVDVLAFDQAIRRGDPASLERAIARYGGPLLEGCVPLRVMAISCDMVVSRLPSMLVSGMVSAETDAITGSNSVA